MLDRCLLRKWLLVASTWSFFAAILLIVGMIARVVAGVVAGVSIVGKIE
mgnify:CR=1 FL=1